MVYGPDFRLVPTLPSVPELLLWADNPPLPTGHNREPIDGPLFSFAHRLDAEENVGSTAGPTAMARAVGRSGPGAF